jgi:hypothetical protein
MKNVFCVHGATEQVRVPEKADSLYVMLGKNLPPSLHVIYGFTVAGSVLPLGLAKAQVRCCFLHILGMNSG